MTKFSKIFLFLFLTLLILLPSVSLAAQVKITLQPEDTWVQEGGNAVFRSRARNDTGITWRMVSPDGQQEFLVKDIKDYFPSSSVTGKNSDTLTIRNVSEAMHQWQVYCTYGGQNRVETNRASILIKGKEEENFLPEETEEVTFSYQGSDILQVTAMGVSLEVNGQSVSSPYDFSSAGKINLRVKALSRAEYWVINGARYDFDIVPQSIIIKDLHWPLTIEAVPGGKESLTLLSDSLIQSLRTGQTLTVLSKTADMCHIRPDKFGAGGWFREFDFTNDFINRATKEEETGGRVTLKVRAYIPEGRKLIYWKLNDAKFIFPVPPSEFYVWNLHESMTYQPVFENVKPTPSPTPKPTPVPMYTITCRNCHFNGGGYTGQTRSGAVPAGTKITVYPERTDLGWWEGLPFATKGTSDQPVTYTSLTFSVNQNLNITWLFPIN